MKQRALKWLADQIPTLRRTIYNVRQMRTELAPDLDVDRVHAIIEDAQAGNVDDLFRLYRDMIIGGSHLQGRFAERKEPVLGDTLSVQPIDKDNPDDVVAAAVIRDLVENCDDWENACGHLLDSVLWPVALVEKTFRPSARVLQIPDGPAVRLHYELATLTVVPYELLEHTQGKLQIRDTDETGSPLGTGQTPDPSRYIIHRGHLLTCVPDNWGGPMRSIIYWWLLGHMDRDWWARYLDRYGMPFLIGKYSQGDDASRSILEQAFRYCTKIGGLVISNETDVALQQATASQSADAFARFLEACNQEISNLVLGQSLSSNAKSTGLGSGVAGLQGEVRQDKRQSDARRLGATLRNQLFRQYLLINGLAGRTPKVIWAGDSAIEAASTGKLLADLHSAGLEPTDDALPVIGERVGFMIQRSAQPTMPANFVEHSVKLAKLGQVEAANAAIVRAGAARLSQIMRKRHAPIAQLVASSKSPADALSRVEAYCSRLDPLESAEISTQAIQAMAANGSVAYVKQTQ